MTEAERAGEAIRKAVLAFHKLVQGTTRGGVKPPEIFGVCDGCSAHGIEANGAALEDLHWHESLKTDLGDEMGEGWYCSMCRSDALHEDEE